MDGMVAWSLLAGGESTGRVEGKLMWDGIKGRARRVMISGARKPRRSQNAPISSTPTGSERGEEVEVELSKNNINIIPWTHGNGCDRREPNIAAPSRAPGNLISLSGFAHQLT